MLAFDDRPNIAIAVGLGWGVRNVLLSDTLASLLEAANVVVYSPYHEDVGFRNWLEHRGVVSRALPNRAPSAILRHLYTLTEIGFFAAVPTCSHRRKAARWAGESAWRRAALKPTATWKMAFPLLRRLYKSANLHSQVVAKLECELRHQRIDMVFLANGYEPLEWPLAFAAQRTECCLVAAVTSWDNPTTQRFLPCQFDRLLAWTESMRQVLIRQSQIDPTSVAVVGSPAFDFYFDPRFEQTRAEFCHRYGLNADQPIAVFTTVTPTIVPDSPELLLDVVRRLRSSVSTESIQLLVRLHPKDKIERYASLRSDPTLSHVRWTQAGESRGDTADCWRPNLEDMIRAVNTVRHGDINIHAGYSTMMLDFAALDKPVIVLGYGSKGKPGPTQQYEQYEHLRPVLESGAITIIRDPAELPAAVSDAWINPSARQRERTALVSQQLGKLDGGSGRRVAETLLQLAAVRRSPVKERGRHCA